MASGSGAAECRAVAAYLRAGEARMRRAVLPEVPRAARAVQHAARANIGQSAHVPRLVGAITFDVTDGGLGAEIGPDQAISGLGVGYEFGSVHTPPHPYLMPAGDEQEPVFGGRVEVAAFGAWEHLP